jgi:hypothetical protein
LLTSGQIALPLFNSKDNFRFQAGYLDGASRYLLDVASTAPSVAYSATLTQFDTIKAYGGFGALQHRWTNTIRSNLVYSFVKIENPIFSGPAVAAETQYGVATAHGRRSISARSFSMDRGLMPMGAKSTRRASSPP